MAGDHSITNRALTMPRTLRSGATLCVVWSACGLQFDISSSHCGAVKFCEALAASYFSGVAARSKPMEDAMLREFSFEHPAKSRSSVECES